MASLTGIGANASVALYRDSLLEDPALWDKEIRKEIADNILGEPGLVEINKQNQARKSASVVLWMYILANVDIEIMNVLQLNDVFIKLNGSMRSKD